VSASGQEKFSVECKHQACQVGGEWCMVYLHTCTYDLELRVASALI
jgi:hypothetical protein